MEKTRLDQAETNLHNSDFKLIKYFLKFCFLSVKMETLHLLDSHLTSFRSYLTYSPHLIPRTLEMQIIAAVELSVRGLKP